MTTRAASSRPRSSRGVAIAISITLAVSGCAAGTLANQSPSATEPATTASPTATPSATVTPSATATPSAPAATVEPTSAPATPSATPMPTPTPAGAPILDLLAAEAPPGFVSTITCEGSIGESDPVAIVWMRAPGGGEQLAPVLRDYADVTQPRTACTFASGDYWIHSLIDARHLVITGPDQRYAVVDLPEVRYRWFHLPGVETSGGTSYGTLIAVAPNLDGITWRRSPTDGSLARQILMTDMSGDHVLTDLPALEGGRCGSPLDSSEGAYSRTGDSYYVLDQLMAHVNVLVAGRGTDVELTLYPPDGGWNEASMPLMALWSPTSETLYYRVGADVMRWRPGSAPELFLRNTPWSRPTFTPDGRHLAYATEDGVYLVDMTRNPAPRLIRADASLPVFLNSTQLWFKVAHEGGCITDETQVRIYDLRDGSEAPSIIDGVLAVWPATSSNSR